ncbi:hypothetical protein bpr_II232 (plasmid) [Butyrivibrio proteoclasticus B316]|uniref:DUF5722 domain-containing protein n=1 Tax=Butyrivibrio proteoclasticus (strain ATCC 51982 / DSM 14932 / B316) TaxID=515622 RepID=E0S437_BUTPB|nr:DUF5722 domain-containing protein [Butyrivibrio proteoclasticus]ADL36169.1 hypothetical protein bpr_II232 [Butyrivibrio proteoclasticus B316]
MRSIKSIILFLVLALAILIPIKAEAADKGKITACYISADKQSVIIEASLPEGPLNMVVIAEEVWQTIDNGTVVANVSGEAVSFPLAYMSDKSNLTKRFCLALPKGDTYEAVSNYMYITNPEILSNNPPKRNDHGIKGILPASTDAEEFNDLGIKQIMFNMELGAIISKTEAKQTTEFTYYGRKYYFKNDVLGEYDKIVKWCTENDYQLTMTLLNAASSKDSNLIHPEALGATCPTYALNTKTEDGVMHLKAIAAFLARRYSGGDFGTIDNWILGNQVNARTEWYYHSSTNLDTNVKEYTKAFRIFYNEFKSVNANADIYISLDQEWNRRSNPGCFLSREYLNRFNYWINKEGNIGWCLGIHPYNAPLYDPYTWMPQDIYVTNDAKTPYLTMLNFDVLLDEMREESYLTSAGKVRKIMISQIGYTSSFGEKFQAASIAYAYSKALKYPEITGFILFRDIDDDNEVKANIAQGLKSLNSHKKLAYEYYKTIGTPEFSAYEDEFEETTGVSLKDMLEDGYFKTRNSWELGDDTDPARESG